MSSETTEREAAVRRVVEAARQMPRATPGPGTAVTLHPFHIEAGVVWELDMALRALDRAEANG